MSLATGFGQQTSRPGAASWGDECPGAFEDLAMPLFASLYNFAHWLTQNREEAEDLVQETYLKALRAFESFQSGNFRAWMFQILRNTFLSSRSKLARRMTVPLDDGEDGSFEPAATCDTAESILIKRCDIDSVRHAIDDLPVDFREPLLLCDVEEMSYREIAEVLSIPIGTVMSRVSRARKAVRDALAKPAATPPAHCGEAPQTNG